MSNIHIPKLTQAPCIECGHPVSEHLRSAHTCIAGNCLCQKNYGEAYAGALLSYIDDLQKALEPLAGIPVIENFDDDHDVRTDIKAGAIRNAQRLLGGE